MKWKPVCSVLASIEEKLMNITVLDNSRFPESVEFPMPKAAKYGWQEFAQLTPDQIGENCWRTHIIITLGTELPSEVLEKLPMLKLVIEGRDGLVDLDAAVERGIAVSRMPEGLGCSHFCQEAVETIDDFMAGKVRHRLI
jgi:phosphoglycerate dehydrogenase-like enzyme